MADLTNPDNPSATFTLTFDDEPVDITIEFHFSDNAEDFINVTEFVNHAAGTLLKALVES
jgi:hypothetical protein